MFILPNVSPGGSEALLLSQRATSLILAHVLLQPIAYAFDPFMVPEMLFLLRLPWRSAFRNVPFPSDSPFSTSVLCRDSFLFCPPLNDSTVRPHPPPPSSEPSQDAEWCEPMDAPVASAGTSSMPNSWPSWLLAISTCLSAQTQHASRSTLPSFTGTWSWSYTPELSDFVSDLSLSLTTTAESYVSAAAFSCWPKPYYYLPSLLTLSLQLPSSPTSASWLVCSAWPLRLIPLRYTPCRSLMTMSHGGHRRGQFCLLERWLPRKSAERQSISWWHSRSSDSPPAVILA